MSESLYCPNQKVLSNQGKENWDNIEWDFDTLDKKFTVSFVHGPPINDEISKNFRKALIDDPNWSLSCD